MSSSVRRVGFVALVVYGASIVLANWLIRNVGPVVVPGGNHLVPVGLGLFAPTGTYAAGVTFVARDVVQRTVSRQWSLLIILPGAAFSALLDVHLALASGAAFLLGELADFAVYTPLQRRSLVRAVLASEICASFVDSVLFLGLAGISLSVAFPGLMLGKLEVGLVTVPLIASLRGWQRSRRIEERSWTRTWRRRSARWTE